MANVSKEETNKQSSGVLEKIAEKRAVPGVVSLTGAMSLLYMNIEAEGICHQVQKWRGIQGDGGMGNEVVPQEIYDLCGALQRESSSGKGIKGCDEIQVRRVIGEADSPVLLRGFLIPSHGEHEPRFLVLMEKLGRRPQAPSHEAKKHFNLTDRELEIIMNVAEGRTNREIAKLLDISEHTVKEHIKHVFKKTGSSTRTGILAQIFRFS